MIEGIIVTSVRDVYFFKTKSVIEERKERSKMTNRNQMISYSDQVAIMKLEKELREDKKKPKVLCDHCSKAVAPEELYEFRGVQVCSFCLLLLRIKLERKKD